MPTDLRPIFKAYDVRGVYPDQFDEQAARRIGRAFSGWVGAERVLVGWDCRLSSPALSSAFMDGVRSEGVGVVELGLATTDMVYFASGRLELPGAMFTASHNPPEYNGLKLCRPLARPIGLETGLEEIRERAQALGDEPGPGAHPRPRERRDMLEEYVEHLLSFPDLPNLRPLTAAPDPANALAGLVVPAVFGGLP